MDRAGLYGAAAHIVGGQVARARLSVHWLYLRFAKLAPRLTAIHPDATERTTRCTLFLARGVAQLGFALDQAACQTPP